MSDVAPPFGPTSGRHSGLSGAGAWSVRRAGPDDAERLSLVARATFLESYTWLLRGEDILAHCRDRHSRASYAAWLESGDALWLAEAERGAPIGYAGLSAPDLPQAQAGDLELKRIYVLSRFHGADGPARALMAAATEEARRLGAPRLLLGLHPQNARALAFYGRSGFRPIGVRTFTVGAMVIDDDVVMALEIAAA